MVCEMCRKIERMDNGKLPKRIYRAEGDGIRGRSRPREDELEGSKLSRKSE